MRRGRREGESLFFLDRHAGTWRQVWATADHYKEKTLELAEPGRMRFAGTVYAGARVLPDRTTLSAQSPPSIRATDFRPRGN